MNTISHEAPTQSLVPLSHITPTVSWPAGEVGSPTRHDEDAAKPAADTSARELQFSPSSVERSTVMLVRSVRLCGLLKNRLPPHSIMLP